MIDPATPIYAPIAGTIVQRKVGPGQYVGSGASDPVFIIGDLSRVWVMAYVRESESPMVRVGQAVAFTVVGNPKRIFPASLTYVASAFGPGTRRAAVRGVIYIPCELFRTDMFATVAVGTCA